MDRSILNRWWWRLLVGLGCCWMQHENSWIIMSPVPAIFLLPGFLIIDGILTAFCLLRKSQEIQREVCDEHRKCCLREGSKVSVWEVFAATEETWRSSKIISRELRRMPKQKVQCQRHHVDNFASASTCVVACDIWDSTNVQKKIVLAVSFLRIIKKLFAHALKPSFSRHQAKRNFQQMFI